AHGELTSLTLERDGLMRVRRIVTKIDEQGHADFVPSETVPKTDIFEYTPGFETALIWSTDCEALIPGDGSDPTLSATSFIPGPGGGARFAFTQLPPDSVYLASTFDRAAALAEQSAKLPGFAELVERDNPGMHVTDTLDYVIVLEGEVW